jgi:MoaD family protein
MPTVKLYANLRQMAGTKELSVPGKTPRLVLQTLVGQFPALEKVLLENGQIRRHVIITVNGQTTVDMDATVMEQDQIAIFPPIAGGGFPEIKELL